jgi:hypothetical protein
MEVGKMDKVLLKFFADVLYIKGKLCCEELEDIMNAKTASDLDKITDKMLNDGYNAYKRGEGYVSYGEPGDTDY